jgi:hypothetical protein
LAPTFSISTVTAACRMAAILCCSSARLLRRPDIVEASKIYQGRLDTGPLVFANACTTVVSDPQGTSELESRFFARNIGAFFGTETRVPVTLASHFAWLFLQFFLRKVDNDPMTAGEVVP